MLSKVSAAVAKIVLFWELIYQYEYWIYFPPKFRLWNSFSHNLFFVKIELRWHNELLNILYCNQLFSLFLQRNPNLKIKTLVWKKLKIKSVPNQFWNKYIFSNSFGLFQLRLFVTDHWISYCDTIKTKEPIFQQIEQLTAVPCPPAMCSVIFLWIYIYLFLKCHHPLFLIFPPPYTKAFIRKKLKQHKLKIMKNYLDISNVWRRSFFARKFLEKWLAIEFQS